jgi:integrase
MLIHVHEGKRSKDRYVMLSERLLEVLRTYWKVVHPSGPFLFPGAIPGRSVAASARIDPRRSLDFSKPLLILLINLY